MSAVRLRERVRRPRFWRAAKRLPDRDPAEAQVSERERESWNQKARLEAELADCRHRLAESEARLRHALARPASVRPASGGPPSEELLVALERIAQLERILAGTGVWLPPPAWRLTRSEAAILGVLVHRQLATSDACMAAIHRDYTRDEPDPKIIDVFICKMRPKLAAHGITIETVWGEGWRLDSETRGRLKRAFSRPSESETAEPSARAKLGRAA